MLGLLEVVAGPDEGRTFALSNGTQHTIGRAAEARLRLQDTQVSPIHCTVTVEGGKARVSDAGSLLGTWVNGQRIAEHALRPGEVICIGGSQLQFQWSDSDEQNTIPWNPSEPEA